MESHSSLTSLTLAARLNLTHRELLRSIARCSMATRSRATWNMYFVRGDYLTTSGQRRRLWHLHGLDAMHLLAPHLPSRPAVWKWRELLDASCPRP